MESFLKSKIYQKKMKSLNTILNKVDTLARKDLQINTDGKFANFTDYQNVMLSNISLLELLWEGCENEINGKTIGELYFECVSLKNQVNINYENIIIKGEDWLKMADKKNWSKYRQLVLGKLVRYGFSKITIIKKINGKNSFDAFLLKDVDENLMVYYPCTNLIELDDFLYDSYNIINSISKNDKNFITKINLLQKIYNSQQLQAKKFLDDCIKLLPQGKSINIFGFSLGASLAETAYLNNYNKHYDFFGNIILFNPYHNNLTSHEAYQLKQSDKLKIYVCEGDLVSTIFNYDEFYKISKPIYINYLENSKPTLKDIDNNKNLVNPVINYIKNNLCDSAINSINKRKENCSKYNFIFKGSLGIAITQINKIKNVKINAINNLKSLYSIIKKIASILKKFGIKFDMDNDFTFLKNIHYLEYIFTMPHLPYLIEEYKDVSFDKKGNLLKTIKINNNKYHVNYPSFNDTSTKIFGSNIYNDVINIVTKLHKK